MFFLILFLVAVCVCFYYIHRHYQYWRHLGVPGPKPKYVFGNIKDNFFMKRSLWEISADIYRLYSNERIVGFFFATTPALIVRDLQLIKEVLINKADYFSDNDTHVDKKTDVIFGRNLFFLKGSDWMEARSQLTPAFTSVKMKFIYPHLEHEGQNLVNFLKTLAPAALNGDGYEGKELCMRFTLNNVGSCAFGLEAKCFEEPNSEFKQIADKFLTPDSMQSLKFFLVALLPSLAKLLTLKIVADDIEEKLINIVSTTLRFRKENNIIRNDFLQILQELRETKDLSLSDVDITGHSGTFFVDGYDTSSLVMAFILYNLATNPEAQATLRQELTKAFEENNNTMPYNVLQELTYLDAVVNESLRIRPSVGLLKRVCTKSYIYQPKEDENIKPFVIKPKTKIFIPIYGLHHDEKYFHNPTQFYPERFVGSNREKINKDAFMPFGQGLRMCIGKQFAILQIKVGLAYIVRNFEVAVNKKTIEPLKYDPIYWLVAAQGGLWLDFKAIT